MNWVDAPLLQPPILFYLFREIKTSGEFREVHNVAGQSYYSFERAKRDTASGGIPPEKRHDTLSVFASKLAGNNYSYAIDGQWLKIFISTTLSNPNYSALEQEWGGVLSQFRKLGLDADIRWFQSGLFTIYIELYFRKNITPSAMLLVEDITK